MVWGQEDKAWGRGIGQGDGVGQEDGTGWRG